MGNRTRKVYIDLFYCLDRMYKTPVLSRCWEPERFKKLDVVKCSNIPLAPEMVRQRVYALKYVILHEQLGTKTFLSAI